MFKITKAAPLGLGSKPQYSTELKYPCAVLLCLEFCYGIIIVNDYKNGHNAKHFIACAIRKPGTLGI